VKLVLTLLARDEVDIVEAGVLYHLERGVDFVVATSNNSRDGTLEVLRRFEREGHLHLIEEPSEDFAQDRWVTRMARLAATDFGADWVMHADADEFWWPSAGTLKDVFTAIPEEYGLLYVPTNVFVPRPDEAGSFADRMAVREVESRMRSGKPHPPKVAHRAAPDVRVAFGNHGASGEGLVPVPGWQPIEILHFPMRSYRQFEDKVRAKGHAVKNNPAKPSRTIARHLESYEAGTLRADYAEMVFGEERVREGIAEGRLVVDRRLQRFLADRAAASGGEGEPAAAETSDPLDLRIDLLRAAARQRREREASQRELARLEGRVAKAEQRAQRAKAHQEKLAARITAMERSPVQRLALGVAQLRKRARR
jgi:hypothetical protein